MQDFDAKVFRSTNHSTQSEVSVFGLSVIFVYSRSSNKLERQSHGGSQISLIYLNQTMRLRIGASALAWLTLSLFGTVCSAIYADEAYETDWHQALLGVPQKQTTFFHRPSPNSKATLLYTLSENHVLGAINPRDGSLVWRQLLGDSNNTGEHRGFLVAARNEDHVISAFRKNVQAWNAADGRQIWEWRTLGSLNSLETLPTTDGGQDAIVLCEEGPQHYVVRRLDGRTGKVKWEHKDDSGDLAYGVSTALDKVYLVSLHSAILKGFKIKVTRLDVKSGATSDHHTLSTESEVQSVGSIKHLEAHPVAPFVAWADKELRVLKISGLNFKKIATIELGNIKEDALKDISIHAAPNTANQAHILIHYQGEKSHRAEVYHVDLAQGSAIPLYELPRTSGLGAFSASVSEDNANFVRITNSEISLYSLTSETPLSTRKISLRSQSSPDRSIGVKHAITEVISKSSSQYAIRSAALLSSGDMELMRDDVSVWIRYESLAGIVAAQWASSSLATSLAEEIAHESQAGVIQAYFHRLKRHARDLQDFPAWAQSFVQSTIVQLTGGKVLPSASIPQRDSFSFHKVLIVARDDGTVSALDVARQGEPIWSREVVSLRQGQKWQVISIEINDNVAVVRGLNGEFAHVQINDGKVLKYQPGGLVAKLKTSLSLPSSDGSTVPMALNTDGSLGDELEKSSIERPLVVVTSGDDGNLRGWSLAPDAKPYTLWQFRPSPDEIIVSTATRPLQDPVASIGKALGDRNVLYKYISRNLLLVITANSVLSTAIVTLLDTSTGKFLYTTTHAGVDVTKPIVSTMSENWFAYSYYSEIFLPPRNSSDTNSEPSRSHNLVVSELFESSIPNDRGPLGSTSNISSLHPSSPAEGLSKSYDPYVLSLAFTIPGPISSMSVSFTTQGITPRTLLCVLPTYNAIMAIPRSVLDPRRPVGRDPTAAEAEEGLFRYAPFIDFEPKWFLNHKRDVLGIRKIITTPTRLESTTLLFAYGTLDLFGTRVQPIGGFDVLGKGFGKLQLVGTVLAFAVGTGFLGPLVSLFLFFLSWLKLEHSDYFVGNGH